MQGRAGHGDPLPLQLRQLQQDLQRRGCLEEACPRARRTTVCLRGACGKVSLVKENYFMPLLVPTLALANFPVFSCSNAKWI